MKRFEPIDQNDMIEVYASNRSPKVQIILILMVAYRKVDRFHLKGKIRGEKSPKTRDIVLQIAKMTVVK